MTTSSALRLVAICLAIAITIIGPKANGFTIDRTKSTPTTLVTDLSSDETILLQVKDDLKEGKHNDIKDETNRTTISNIIAKIKHEKISTTPEVQIEYTSTTARVTTVPSTTEFVKIPTISSDTVEVFDSVEDISFSNKTEKISDKAKGTLDHSESKFQTTVKSVEISKPPTTTAMTIDKTQLPVEISTVVDNLTTEKETTKTIARFSVAKESTIPLHITKEMPRTSSEITTDIIYLNATKTSDTGADISRIQESKSLNVFKTQLNNAKVLESTIFDLNTTQSITEQPVIRYTEPFSDKYTKYTTIIRKRVSSSEETTATTKTEEDTMKAETSNTHINLEKAFNATLIPSLQKIGDELLSNIDQVSSGEVVYLKTEKFPSEANILPSSLDVIKSTVPAKQGTVQTKRAGYLNNSEKATTLTTPITSVENTTVSHRKNETKTKTFRTVDYNKVMEIESPDSRKLIGSESFSQLAEDAIQEELLKEEALYNHEENVNRYHEGNAKPIPEASGSVATVPNTDDSLSVQPIERTKTTIYTISDNYKPMKKIDVQPAKPFVRDPDDNSWRNESISSLGIVFKPKTSSKSFKEVLKNKTQNELNNLLEKVNNDVPDLRVRLEKIAEVRKKKKMNKSGEVVYTDYEESTSDENNSTGNLDLVASILSSGEMSKLIAPLRSQSNPDVTTPISNSSPPIIMDKNTTTTQLLLSNLSLDSLSTEKPAKLFNIAEYYDTTDDYDADYVTMSKIDLKKFTVPPTKTTLLITKPKEPYFPERKPSVQYFPPREPQKVNVNNHDKNFERKVNLFTYKNRDRIEPQPPFVTLPPIPIAIAKPPSDMRPLLPMRPPKYESRPDMSPTDFSIYSPVDMNKNYYVTNAPRSTEPQNAFIITDGHFDRGSYVIKHYRDFLNAAIKDNDEDSDLLPHHTTLPPRETAYSHPTEPDKPTYRSGDEDQDYVSHFRKEVLTQFVDNFNQNSERFKVDFPVLYNNSIVHRREMGAPAASRTFLKRLYHDGAATRANGLLKKPCEPNCELTVELSPAYELHYYVPGQEEREEPRTSPAPYRYGL